MRTASPVCSPLACTICLKFLDDSVIARAYLFCHLPSLPLACFSAPLPRRGRIDPRPPSPPGKGEIFSFLMQGASPLASPRLSRKRHGLNLRDKCPEGACPLGRLPTLPLALLLPPSPRPPSLREGGDYKFILPGASPLASRGLDGARHWLGEHWRYPARGSRLGRRIALPPLHPAGWGKQSGDPEDPPRGGSAAGCRQIVAC